MKAAMCPGNNAPWEFIVVRDLRKGALPYTPGLHGGGPPPLVVMGDKGLNGGRRRAAMKCVCCNLGLGRSCGN
jgi:hypothetical protein